MNKYAGFDEHLVPFGAHRSEEEMGAADPSAFIQIVSSFPHLHAVSTAQEKSYRRTVRSADFSECVRPGGRGRLRCLIWPFEFLYVSARASIWKLQQSDERLTVVRIDGPSEI